MFTGIATVQRHGTRARLGRRIAASASALALVMLLTGNVAASRLERDDQGNGALVTPRLNPTVVSRQWISLKLATSAGYRILVYG